MGRAWQDARTTRLEPRPVVEVLIPSTLDDTLCPPASMSPACLPARRSGTAGSQIVGDHREEVADLMIATVNNYAPGFAASVIGRQILSPLDLERQFGLIGGDIFHGALTLNQLFSARPMLGHADYRGPLKGLYHCGSGAASRRRRHRRARPQRRARESSGTTGRCLSERGGIDRQTSNRVMI